MKAVVTGANGFIGSHLVEYLLQAKFEVSCLQRGTSNPAFLQGLPIKTEVIDYQQPETLAKSPALLEADYIFHAAGVTKRVTKAQFIEGNVEPAQNLLEVLSAREDKPKRFVFISSQAALGPSDSLQHLRRKTNGQRRSNCMARANLSPSRSCAIMEIAYPTRSSGQAAYLARAMSIS